MGASDGDSRNEARGAPDAAAADAAPRQASDEAARARAYLDLWERHLVHLAIHGRLAPASGAARRP